MSGRDVVQRACKECEEEKKEPPRIQRVASAESGGLDVSGAVSATQRNGAPLPSDVRSFFEPRFGHDFSDVRVPPAARLLAPREARQLGHTRSDPREEAEKLKKGKGAPQVTHYVTRGDVVSTARDSLIGDNIIRLEGAATRQLEKLIRDGALALEG